MLEPHLSIHRAHRKRFHDACEESNLTENIS